MSTDLAKGVEFITQKLDEYEKDRREKDAIIANLQSELKSASMKVEDLEKKNGQTRTVLQEKLYFNSWIERRTERKYR